MMETVYKKSDGQKIILPAALFLFGFCACDDLFQLLLTELPAVLRIDTINISVIRPIIPDRTGGVLFFSAND